MLLAALALVLALLASACGGSSAAPAGQLRGQVVSPAFEVDPTTFTTTGGEDFSFGDPGARLSLVFFGYTHCPDVCPLVMSTISSALTRLDAEQREQVQLVFVTTDPPRDDAETIDAYLRGYRPDGVGAVGLSADLDDVVTVAESVGIFVADAEELASGGYDLGSHGAQVIAVDGTGQAPVYWPQDVSSAELAGDVATLLEES